MLMWAGIFGNGKGGVNLDVSDSRAARSLPALQETWVQSIGQEAPMEKKWLPTPIFCLENPMDRGVWSAAVHRVTMSWT